MDTVAHIVKYNSLSNGRDKLCRLFQYASKLAGWHATQHGNKDLVHKLKNLENSLSASRKVLRLGKSVDMVQGAVKSLGTQDPLVRLCLVLSKLNTAVYLLVDHYVWATKIGLTSANAKDLAKIASRFWLAAIIMNLIRNLYDIVTMMENQRREQRKLKEGSSSIARYSERDYRLKQVSPLRSVLANKPVMVDMIKNVSDIWLPLTNLGYINTPVQVQGILGMISSVMGILSIWDPQYKL